MLILLADTRKKLLWLWISFTVIITLFVLIHTLTNKLEFIVGSTWLWAFINLLPALLVLLIGVLLNKNPSKVVLKTAFQFIYIASLAYLLFVLGTQFAIPLAAINQSIEDYLNQSYIWLLPFQAILIIAFSILYFRKMPFFKPNEKILLEFVNKKAEYAQRKGITSQEQAYEMLLADDKMNDLFEHLKTHVKTGKNDILLIQSQYNEWQRQRDLNLLLSEELQRELNRITLASINYIEKLE
jgi:Effector-associated domain 11